MSITINGRSGVSGYSGYSGYSGVSGHSGISGDTGASGFSGFSGITSSSPTFQNITDNGLTENRIVLSDNLKKLISNDALISSAIIYATNSGSLGNSEIDRVSQGSYKIKYNTSNYCTINVGSDGGVTFDSISEGSGAGFTFLDNVILSQKNIVTDTSVGTKIGTATNQKISFFNATPIVQPSAYTQTYVSISKTLDNNTASDLSLTATNVFPWGFASSAQAASIETQFNKLRDDLDNTKNVLNQLITDLKQLGIIG